MADDEAEEDAQPSDAGLAKLLAGLAAVDDGRRLADPHYVGPDLLIGSPAQLVTGGAVRVEEEADR